jgi:glutathione synthase/RimK-type ligase-like ATP-grasp enzyme
VILVVTHSSDVTADFMCERLSRDRISFLRIDSDLAAANIELSMRDEYIELRSHGMTLSPSDVQCVWLRRPKPIDVEADDPAEGSHTSTEWGEALEGFLSQIPGCRWINHPSSNIAASRKLEQLARAKRFGLAIPPTLVTQDIKELEAFLSCHHGVIIKPISHGYLERQSPSQDTLIFTSRVSRDNLTDPTLLRRCPTLFQAEIPKHYDVRINCIDSRTTAVRLSRDSEEGRQILDIRRDNMAGVEYRVVNLPENIDIALKSLLGSYGLRFAAVDFAVDHIGRWIFFEINPNGQWAWLDQARATDVAGDLEWAMTRRLQ